MSHNVISLILAESKYIYTYFGNADFKFTKLQLGITAVVCGSTEKTWRTDSLLARGGDLACEYRSGLLSLLTEAPQKQSLSAMVWLIPTRVHAACSACWRPRQNRVSETLGPLVADTNRPAYLIRPIESARVPSCFTVCLAGEKEREGGGGGGERERERQTDRD